jgi:hypothetical protein
LIIIKKKEDIIIINLYAPNKRMSKNKAKTDRNGG